MTTPERRRTPRTKVREIVYVDMGPNNGGVVLNVSEGGIAISTAVPIQRTAVIQFSLLVSGAGRMDGAGGVAWSNKSGKTFGLRFASFSGEAGGRLSRWVNPVSVPKASSQSQKPGSESRKRVSPHSRVSTSVDSSPNPNCSPSLVRSSSERGPFDALTAEDLASMPSGAAAMARPFVRWMSGCLLVAAMAAGVYLYVRGPGKFWVGPSNEPVANVGSQPKVMSHRPPGTDATRSESAGMGTVGPSTPEAGQSELAAALESLHAPGDRRDPSSAARLLQVAIKIGNTTAGVVLAEMYLTGDGVQKSCSHARALLTAAAQKANSEAKIKLKELEVKGCR
jgi:hypothetical protein